MLKLWLKYREWRFVGMMLKYMRSLHGVKTHRLQRSMCEQILEGWCVVTNCHFGDSYLSWDAELAADIVDEDDQFESTDYAGC